MEYFNGHPESGHGAVTLVRQPDPRGVRAPYSEAAGAYYGYEGSDDSDSGGLLEYWRILRRHKGTLFLFAFGGIVLAILISLPQTPVYRAHTSLEVLSMNEDFMGMKQSSPVTTTDYSYDTSEEQTQVKLLESDSLLQRVIAKLDPGAADTDQNPQPAASGWRKLLHLSAPSSISPRQRLLNKLAGSLKVRVTPRTRIMEATVDSTDPKLAMQFANTLSEEFIQQNLEARWKTTERTSDWLTRELEAERTKLEHSEAALQEYARDSGLIFTDDTTNVATEKLQQVQQELSTATADRIAKQSRYELAQNSPPDSLPDVLNDTALQATQAKIIDLHRQIADLSAIYTPDYSKLKRAQAEVAALQTAFDRDRADIVTRIKNDYDEASRKEKLLAAAYNAQTREVTGQDEKAIQYNILKREVDSNRQLYDTMLQQLKQSSIASALHASNVRVVDPAELPTVPVSPNYKINSAFGLFGGALLGLAFVFIRERADRTLQQPGETQLWTNLPELGTIPSASVDGEKKIGYRQHNALEAPEPKNDPSSIELMTWNRKPSLTAEAFRATLTSILFVGENGSRPRVLVLTSASPSDGKTTVVSNLGIALAEIRRKVLIIDADLRRPRMHELFHVPNERGLGDLLREEFLADEAVEDMIQTTEVPGLDVLPSGPPTHAAANLLYSPNLASLIAKMRKQYDMVLIDTPPMLQMTDARVAGRLADGVILVARSQQTTRDAITAASQRFAEDRTRVLGTILNGWDPKRSPNGYYGYYKGSYYSSYRHRDSSIS